jgi:hypothetical protein
MSISIKALKRFRFFNLPRELRDKIDHCLLADGPTEGANGWANLRMFLQHIKWRGCMALQRVQACAPEFTPAGGYGKFNHTKYLH